MRSYPMEFGANPTSGYWPHARTKVGSVFCFGTIRTTMRLDLTPTSTSRSQASHVALDTKLVSGAWTTTTAMRLPHGRPWDLPTNPTGNRSPRSSGHRRYQLDRSLSEPWA